MRMDRATIRHLMIAVAACGVGCGFIAWARRDGASAFLLALLAALPLGPWLAVWIAFRVPPRIAFLVALVAPSTLLVVCSTPSWWGGDRDVGGFFLFVTLSWLTFWGILGGIMTCLAPGKWARQRALNTSSRV